MKKHYLIGGLSALTILATTAGVIGVVQASPNNGSGLGKFSQGKMRGAEVRQNLTETQKADLKIKMATQKTKLEAVQTALDAGNYDNWVIAMKALNDKSPLLTKITASNFSQYVQANSLSKQAEVIYKTLGLEQGGFGPGKMMGGQRGPGRIEK